MFFFFYSNDEVTVANLLDYWHYFFKFDLFNYFNNINVKSSFTFLDLNFFLKLNFSLHFFSSSNSFADFSNSFGNHLFNSAANIPYITIKTTADDDWYHEDAWYNLRETISEVMDYYFFINLILNMNWLLFTRRYYYFILINNFSRWRWLFFRNIKDSIIEYKRLFARMNVDNLLGIKYDLFRTTFKSCITKAIDSKFLTELSSLKNYFHLDDYFGFYAFRDLIYKVLHSNPFLSFFFILFFFRDYACFRYFKRYILKIDFYRIRNFLPITFRLQKILFNKIT